MPIGEIEKLRNVGLLGQGGCGKTRLGEAMFFAAGATQRLGRVQDGTSAFDHEPEEIKHQACISTAFHSLNWKKHLLPVDRHAGIRRIPRRFNELHAGVSGSAVFVLNPSVGRRVESESLWTKANETRHLPDFVYRPRWTTSRQTRPNGWMPC